MTRFRRIAFSIVPIILKSFFLIGNFFRKHGFGVIRIFIGTTKKQECAHSNSSRDNKNKILHEKTFEYEANIDSNAY